jgi:hypothetical protein
MAESLNINDFKGFFISGARPNLYKVRAEKLGGKLEFLCKASSLPASNVEAIDVPYLGRQIKVPGNRIFEEWTVTVFNDTDFEIRRMVESWMNAINGHQDNLGFASVRDVYSDAHVTQLGRDGAELYTYHIIDMFPTMLAPIDLAFDANDEVEEFEVTFNYNYWTSEETS